MKRKILYTVLIAAGLLLFAVGGILGYLQFTEYKPAPVEQVQAFGKGSPLAADKTEFSVMTWNIGYAGLGRETDYFYDGGTMVQPEKKDMEFFLKGIYSELKSTDSLDFIFLQEVDINSKRSYHEDQLQELKKALPEHCYAFALNYKVAYIPIPVLEPIGQVNAGICTFSKNPSESNERHAYDAFFSWPKRLAFLKRCFLASSFEVCGGRQLIMVNLHNSAYDVTGELRSKELVQLQAYLQREYQEGNFIVVGGDWNMNPRGFLPELISSGDKAYSIQPAMDSTFMPGWQIVYDPALPTNRNTDAAYKKGVTGTTVIDFFLVSPNVTVLKCFTLDKGFENTDHNPVFFKFRLQAEVPGFSFL
jgi:endonuclease/exonuclease/phosphatase family metal-dependent hydrolase